MNSFQDPEHLKAFCEAQNKTIIELSKRIQELEDENKELKSSPKKDLAVSPKYQELIKLDKSEQEVICRVQLILLRDSSLQRELTLEEARKLEIYTKIMTAIDARNKSLDVPFKELTDDELIKELEEKNVAEGS